MHALLSSVRPRTSARRGWRSRLAPVLLAGSLTAALTVADATVAVGTASAGGSVAQFERLARCESGGNWAINTGNGYYGGLQFSLPTWRGLGLRGYPHQASKTQQIAAGQKLHSQRGWKPWPGCTRKLGLSGDGGYRGDGTETLAAATSRAPSASRSRPAAPAPVVALTNTGRAVRGTPAKARATRAATMRTLPLTAAPAFDGRVLSTRDARTYRPAVKVWQARMAARGWAIRADGYFGPQSAGVARSFARDKRITSPVPGTVDKALWSAAWTAPVT